jgi:hypothetical protein
MAKRGIIGFVAGFVATLVFHQAVLWILHHFGYVPNAPWPMKHVPPFGIPAVISLAFWGGVWGVIMMPLIERRRGAAFWIAAIVFGAICPTLVAWFVVAPLKHMPIAGGWNPKTMMIGPLVNGAWGFGTALIYRLFIKR